MASQDFDSAGSARAAAILRDENRGGGTIWDADDMHHRTPAETPPFDNHSQMVEAIDVHSAALRLILRLIRVLRGCPASMQPLGYRGSGALQQMQRKLDDAKRDAATRAFSKMDAVEHITKRGGAGKGGWGKGGVPPPPAPSPTLARTKT
jgi:hypothetical protein